MTRLWPLPATATSQAYWRGKCVWAARKGTNSDTEIALGARVTSGQLTEHYEKDEPGRQSKTHQDKRAASRKVRPVRRDVTGSEPFKGRRGHQADTTEHHQHAEPR